RFDDGGWNRWSHAYRLNWFYTNRLRVDGKIHLRHRASWLQLIVQAMIRCPNKKVGSSVCIAGLDKNLVLSPLDLERWTPGSDLHDRFRNLDHRQVVQSGFQVHDPSPIAGFGLNLLSKSRDNS